MLWDTLYQKIGNQLSVRVKDHDQWIGTVSIDGQFSKYYTTRFTVKFDSPKNTIWNGRMDIKYDDGHAQIKWQSLYNNDNILIKYNSPYDGTTSNTKFTANIGDKYLKYSSHRVWIKGRITGKSGFETNLKLYELDLCKVFNLQEYFRAKKTLSNYDIKYTKVRMIVGKKSFSRFWRNPS